MRQLEEKLQGKLHQAARLRGLNLADGAGRTVQIIHRNAKVGVIENVEEFGAELQVPRFRQFEILQRGKIPLLHAGTGHDIAACIAELPGLSNWIEPLKRSRIEPAIRSSSMRAVRANTRGGIAD